MKIVIDGNIGSGKTTQLLLLQRIGGIVYKEPIEEWPLKEFYEDPKKGIFPLQMAVLRTVCDKGPGIYERSLLSSRWVFWEWAKAKNLVEHEKTYEYFYERHTWSPDLYIFIDKPPSDCHRHISSRRQVGDDKVSLEYLKELDMLYKDLLEKIECPIHIMDGTRRPEEIHAEILHIINNNERSEVLFCDGAGDQVQKLGEPRRKVRGAPCPDMCSVS